MVTLCHPVDDLELAFIVAALESVEIPYFVVGQYFSALFPGAQVPWYNERTIRVAPTHLEAALEVLAEMRETYVGPSEELAVKSKIRMFFELVVFGWVMPGGKKRVSP